MLEERAGTSAVGWNGSTRPERLEYPRFALDKTQHGDWATIPDIERLASDLDNGQKGEQVITLTGRIHAKRESSSKLVFYDVVQNGQQIQVVASKGRFEGQGLSFEEASHILSRGDIAAFTGVPGKTKRGQPSLFVTREMRVLAPCLRDIPSRSGLSDPEKRFRQRYLDFLVNAEASQVLRVRSQVIRYIREFLDKRGFMEVETPVLSVNAGGASARPFKTHAHALDMDMQLRIAPELYLKQLVVSGFDRVYEIGKQFRNEGIDADHNPEFTTCEFYQAYGNLDTLMTDTEELLSGLVKSIHHTDKIKMGEQQEIDFGRPFARVHVMDCLEAALNTSLADILQSHDTDITVEKLWDICKAHGVSVTGPVTVPRILDKLISHFIEPGCVQPTFLYNHPVALSPLAKGFIDDQGRAVAARFELFVDGKELVNAYEELNNPEEQRKRFEEQARDRLQGDLDAPIPDLNFCEALEYGLPPTAGWGMGIDRVVQMLTNSSHIREVLAFPVMKPLPPR